MRTFSVWRIFRVLLEQLEQLRQHVDPAPLHLDEPGLVVQPGGDDVHVAAVQFRILRAAGPCCLAQRFDAVGDLPVRALHAVAQADRLHAAVLVAGPGVHRHRVGVVQEQRARFGDLADVLAEVEQRGDGALGVHDAARAERIAHALVDAVLQRDIDIELEGFQPALADHADHVIAVRDGRAAVEGREDLRRQPVGLDIALAQLGDHIQVALRDIREGKGGIASSGTARMSRISRRVKPIEPAPIMAILIAM